MELSIRPAAPRDLAAIVAIQRAAPESGTWSAEALEASLAGGGAAALVAEAGPAVAGFLLWRSVAADEMEILLVAVDPVHRRQGVASALVARALANRSGKCFLEVRTSNSAARALYRKTGFEEHAVRPGYYHHPVEDAVLMRRVEIPSKDRGRGH